MSILTSTANGACINHASSRYSRIWLLIAGVTWQADGTTGLSLQTAGHVLARATISTIPGPFISSVCAGRTNGAHVSTCLFCRSVCHKCGTLVAPCCTKYAVGIVYFSAQWIEHRFPCTAVSAGSSPSHACIPSRSAVYAVCYAHTAGIRVSFSDVTPTKIFDESLALLKDRIQEYNASNDSRGKSENLYSLATLTKDEIFIIALRKAQPWVTTSSLRRGGKKVIIPEILTPAQQESIAIRWLILNSRNTPGKSMAECLANEFFGCLTNQGKTINQREQLHKLAEANRAWAN